MKKKSSPKRLGPFLREARQNSGLTQNQVAKSLGYSSAQFISEWERGVRSPPGNVFNKLLNIYKISAEDFYAVLRDERIACLNEELEADRRILSVKAL